MSASEAQINANRLNAQKSTGPKTTEGKEKSRLNALKHGLCSSVVIPEDIELLEARELDWYHALKPQNTAQSWLCDKIALYSLRIDRSERIERRLRDRKAVLSEVAWEEDRRSEAETLGSKIRKQPARVAEELRRTPAGCDWLIRRWTMLEESIHVVGPWKPDQVALAFDLLGTPLEFREGRSPSSSDDQVGLCQREIGILTDRREASTDLDEIDRSLTEADLFDESHPELKRLRRYESALHSRIRWCMSQFKYESPHHRPHPELRPNRTVETEAESVAPKPQFPSAPPDLAIAAVAVDVSKEKGEGKDWPKPFRFWMAKPPHPPFDLRPDEIPSDGSAPDILKIAVARELARQKRSEARYESRRRSLEKRRA